MTATKSHAQKPAKKLGLAQTCTYCPVYRAECHEAVQLTNKGYVVHIKSFSYDACFDCTVALSYASYNSRPVYAERDMT